MQDISKPERAAQRKTVETRLAQVLAEHTQRDVDPLEVIIHGFDIKSVRATSRNDEAGIMIARHPRPVPFDQDSSLFASIDEGYAEASIEVYAPITWESRTDRNRVIRALREPLQEAITAELTEAIQNGENA